MPRKRGAPPGNKNAYRHGFYSQQFKDAENRALDNISAADLSGEIEFVRVYLRRFIESQDALSAPLELEARLAVLRAITLSAESINSMIRTQLVLDRSLNETEQATALLTDLRLEGPDSPDDPSGE